MMSRPALPVRLGGALIATAIALAAPRAARAEDSEAARCRIQAIHALPGEKDSSDSRIDEKIARLKPRLTRPPFLHWKLFKLLSEEEHALKPTEAAEYALPGGHKARLVYAEHDTEGGKHRVRGSFNLEGGKSASRTMFALDEGGVLLIAGQPHEGGVLIYALSCTTH